MLRNNTTPIGSESAALTVGTLYRVGLRQKKGTGNNAILEAYLATGEAAFGAAFASTSTGTWTSQATALRFGATSNDVLNATFDNIRLDSGAMPPAGYAPGGGHVLAAPRVIGQAQGVVSPASRRHWRVMAQGGLRRPVGAPLAVSTPPAGQTWKVYYYAGAQLIGMRELTGAGDGELYYLHGDHLGSTSITTCGNVTNECSTLGAVHSSQRYYPFGSVRTGGGLPTDREFTGQYSDDALGLYYYGARYYDPLLGRFAQADTMVPGAGNPQSWNRFVYVLNNPLKYTDPTGHMEDDGCNTEGCDAEADNNGSSSSEGSSSASVSLNVPVFGEQSYPVGSPFDPSFDYTFRTPIQFLQWATDVLSEASDLAAGSDYSNYAITIFYDQHKNGVSLTGIQEDFGDMSDSYINRNLTIRSVTGDELILPLGIDRPGEYVFGGSSLVQPSDRYHFPVARGDTNHVDFPVSMDGTMFIATIRVYSSRTNYDGIPMWVTSVGQSFQFP